MACDVSTDGEGNPYVLQLLHALERDSRIEAVQHGTSWLQVTGVDFDVIHVQWPEALFGFQEPTASELSQLARHLDRWQVAEGTPLVVTVHNEYPHGQDTARFKRLYQLVYERADAFIHLGERSREVVRRRYTDEIGSAFETVIPHGDYSYYPDEISREEARDLLSVPPDVPVWLVFGSVREDQEVDLLRKAFSQARQVSEQLVVASQLPHRPLRDWQHVPTRLPLWLNSHVHLHESYVPAKQVQIYLNAADVLVLPRIDALNSGTVALGWTFGTVVVGPSQGVIGEMLDNQGCPAFKSPSPEALAEAMQKGLHQAHEGKGKELREFATRRLNWDRIADSHIGVYSSFEEEQ
jgi:glycosyltransferase involved in cell wall biosynthesis